MIWGLSHCKPSVWGRQLPMLAFPNSNHTAPAGYLFHSKPSV